MNPSEPLDVGLNNRKTPSFDHFYVSLIREEVRGRPLPGAPIKLMGASPRIIGTQLAKLIAVRFHDIDVTTLESMPRLRLITLQLRKSYLSITFEFPIKKTPPKAKSVVFSQFVASFKNEILKTLPHPDLLPSACLQSLKPC